MNEFTVPARNSKIIRFDFRKNNIKKQTCMPVQNKVKISIFPVVLFDRMTLSSSRAGKRARTSVEREKGK